jgi:hypothetical protein
VGWRGAVSKNVTEVSITLMAQDLGSAHEKTIVALSSDIFRLDGIPKTRPAGSRIKLRLRIKQFISATDALVDPLFLAVVVLSRKSSLRTFLATYLVLFGTQLFFPLLIRLENFFIHLLVEILEDNKGKRKSRAKIPVRSLHATLLSPLLPEVLCDCCPGFKA